MPPRWRTHDIAGIDLLVSNLYPFEETLKGGADAATIVENIDIGGPAMIRAGAKNHGYVTVVTDPADYDGGARRRSVRARRTDLALRRQLAAARLCPHGGLRCGGVELVCRRSIGCHARADELCG